jgi:hypothetical protein
MDVRGVVNQPANQANNADGKKNREREQGAGKAEVRR